MKCLLLENSNVFKVRTWLMKFCFLVFFCLFLSSCASLGTYNPATGRNEIILISSEEEVAMGNSVHKQIKKKYAFSDNESIVNGLRKIGGQLAQVADRKDYEYHFYLVNSEEINAFTTPGGNIYVFTGLMSKLSSDDELAAVLAHEIGHCAAKHVVKKYQAALGYSLVGSIALSYLGKYPSAHKLASLSSDAIMGLIASAYSRKDEYEADKLGLKYLHLSGFKLEGMVKAFKVLESESKGPKVPEFLRTHPDIKDRIEKVKDEIDIINQNSIY